MPEPILCKICGKRRARRYCPAVEGDICPICCGTEREVSLTCPLECEHVQTAHRREKPIPVEEKQLSYPEITVSEELIGKQEEFLLFCVFALLESALHTAGAIDTDVMEALEAVIRTERTAESGLLYETRPENYVAMRVQRAFTASLADYHREREEREALSPVKSSEVLAVLVFLHRIGQQNQNGRPRGRMFLDLLRRMTPKESVSERQSGIII